MEHIYFFTNDLTIGFITRMLDLSFRSIMKARFPKHGCRGLYRVSQLMDNKWVIIIPWIMYGMISSV